MNLEWLRKDGHLVMLPDAVLLVPCWADVTQRRMPTFLIVSAVDVAGQLPLQFAVRRPGTPMDQPPLERSEETLHHRVVPAIAWPAHAHHRLLRGQRLPVVGRSVDTPTVGVVQQAQTRLPAARAQARLEPPR